MRKLFMLMMMGLVAAGGAMFFKKFQVHGLESIRVQPRTESGTPGATEVGWARPETTAPPVGRTGNTIRIASFNIQVFGEAKANKPQVMDVLVDIVRRFDIVAIQEIRAKSQDILPRFVERINATGRQYDFVIGERLGRTTSTEQYAYIFDAQSVEVDRSAVYTVADPDRVMHRPPLVAAFRVRGPPTDQAFTFALVDVHTDPDETDTELNFLDDVFRAVRDDGRGEDDIIILGDLNVDDKHLGELGKVPGIAWAITGVPTNTRGTKLYDNIVFHRASTTEFTGRAGVFDVMREYNLTTQQALEVSDHLPIWAEFSIHEALTPGRMANQPGGLPNR